MAVVGQLVCSVHCMMMMMVTNYSMGGKGLLYYFWSIGLSFLFDACLISELWWSNLCPWFVCFTGAGVRI